MAGIDTNKKISWKVREKKSEKQSIETSTEMTRNKIKLRSIEMKKKNQTLSSSETLRIVQKINHTKKFHFLYFSLLLSTWFVSRVDKMRGQKKFAKSYHQKGRKMIKIVDIRSRLEICFQLIKILSPQAVASREIVNFKKRFKRIPVGNFRSSTHEVITW